ncbi:MAG: YbaB/EbfC family nucleoid-associated protein [Labedaea sp.]
MPEGVDAGEQLMANWNKQIQERAERYRAMARRLDEQTVTETSADKAVAVTLSSRGMLTDMTLTDAAAAKGMAQLATLIMTTARRAQARIPELLRQTMADTVGTDGPTASRLLAEARQHFPAVAQEPVPELWRELDIAADEGDERPASQRPRRPPQRPAEDDDEFRVFGEF